MTMQFELSYRDKNDDIVILWVSAPREAVDSLVEIFDGAITANELGANFVSAEDINYHLLDELPQLMKKLKTSVKMHASAGSLSPFEITPSGFDGSAETDHHIIWVLADNIATVEMAVQQSGTPATVTHLPESFSDDSSIDFTLPDEKLGVINRLKSLAQSNK